MNEVGDAHRDSWLKYGAARETPWCKQKDEIYSNAQTPFVQFVVDLFKNKLQGRI